jgi:hypothetical protein
VLHGRSGNALLSGDIVQVPPGARRVSFMYSYPMLLQLPAREVERIVAALAPWEFERIYGAWCAASWPRPGRTSSGVLRSATCALSPEVPPQEVPVSQQERERK